MNLISWVVNKEENLSVDFTFLKGSAFLSWESYLYCEEDEAWLERMRSSLTPQMASLCKVKINVIPATTDVPLLEFGSVLIDKATGKITIPRPRDIDGLPGRQGGGGSSSSGSSHSATSFILALGPKSIMEGPKDITHRSVAGSLRRLESTLDTIFNLKGYTSVCVYNGTRRLAVPVLSECTRELLRSRTLGQPDSRRHTILRRYDPEPDLRQDKYREAFIHLGAMGGTGMFLCDLPSCRRMGKLVCKTCGGSWACSEKHQAESAGEHEEWCKTHRIRI